MNGGPVTGLRFRRLRSGPPDTVAGDLEDGVGQVGRLLHPAGSEAAIAAGKRARVGSAPFETTTAVAAEKLEAILDGEGVLVSTGQQPGLFLGPLFTLYKILTAASHASRIEAATGRPALASFWIAGDDHDWKEVGTASLVDRAGVLHRFVLEPEASEAERGVGQATLGRRIEPILVGFLEAAGESEFAPEVSEILRSAYRPESTVSGAFREALKSLLAGVDVALFDPSHPEARRASIAFLTSLLRQPETVTAAIASGSARLEEAGYEIQLRPPSDGSQVFYDDGRSRAHLIGEAAGFRHGRAGQWRSTEDWVSLLESDPSRFSPAAATRPLLESVLLPVARTILGPGELAYWAQLGLLFDRMEVPMPETVSRDAWMILEPRVERWLEGIGTDPADLEDGSESVERRLTAEHRPETVDRRLHEFRAELSGGLAELADATRSELPGLDAAFGKADKALQDALTVLEGTIDTRVREARQTSLQRVRRAAALLYPEGRRQERVDSPISFLVRYGQLFLEESARASGIESGPRAGTG
jgi:bacillithiol biosynthesis cysteine-adding enzyme BshC